MTDSLANTVRGPWMRRFFDAALSNLLAVVPVVLFVVPAVAWWFSESTKELIEGNSYRIESIDRYAAPSNTHAQLLGSDRLTLGSTRIAIVLSGASPCSRQPSTATAGPTPLDMGTLIGTMPPGLLATIRFTRRSTTSVVNFEITSGRILFIAMQGDDLPKRICFNPRRDQLTIEYSASDTADISPRERVLFVQTDEPASDIRSKNLRERSLAYFAVSSLAGVCVFVFLVGLLGLIIRNGRQDRTFRDVFAEKHEHMNNRIRDANIKLDRLREKHDIFDDMLAHLENVGRDSDFIKEILQRSNLAKGQEQKTDLREVLQELKRQGTADGEQRFKAGAADSRQRFARAFGRDAKSNQRRNADPRVEIRDMKSDIFD